MASMKLFSLFRIRPLLRDLARVASALEEHNHLLRTHWGIREKRSPASPMEISSFDVAAANKSYLEQLIAEGVIAEGDE